MPIRTMPSNLIADYTPPPSRGGSRDGQPPHLLRGGETAIHQVSPFYITLADPPLLPSALSLCQGPSLWLETRGWRAPDWRGRRALIVEAERRGYGDIHCPCGGVSSLGQRYLQPHVGSAGDKPKKCSNGLTRARRLPERLHAKQRIGRPERTRLGQHVVVGSSRPERILI